MLVTKNRNQKITSNKIFFMQIIQLGNFNIYNFI